MEVNFIEEELRKFENLTVCNKCTKKLLRPVRIKVCGHYFCETCLKTCKITDQCPKCKEHYDKSDMDYNNTAIKLYKHLEKLKNIVKDISLSIEISNNVQTLLENTFVYENHVYHVNYLDELCKKINNMGESPLHVACRRKKLTDVEGLLEKGIDINIQDFAGWAPIHEAVQSNSLEIVKLLLKKGALIDIMGEEYTTPLHKAVMLNNKEMVEFLLEHGASKNIGDYFGKKPMEYVEDPDVKKSLEKDYVCKSRVQELFCSKKITAYCYNLESEYIDKLKQIKDTKILNEFDKRKTTHFFIQKNHNPSVKILSAIVNGCLIVPQDWIDNYLKDINFFHISTQTYSSTDKLNKGIQQAMINSFLKLPQLFDGIRFYIYGHRTKISLSQFEITKEELMGLIIDGGGKILPRAPTPSTCEEFKNYPFHANKGTQVSNCCHYIIYEVKDPPTPLYKMPDLKHKSSQWLIDCIMNFTILD